MSEMATTLLMALVALLVPVAAAAAIVSVLVVGDLWAELRRRRWRR